MGNGASASGSCKSVDSPSSPSQPSSGTSESQGSEAKAEQSEASSITPKTPITPRKRKENDIGDVARRLGSVELSNQRSPAPRPSESTQDESDGERNELEVGISCKYMHLSLF